MSLVVWMKFKYEMPPFFPQFFPDNSVFLLPTENKLVVDGMQHSWYSFVSSLKYAVWCLFLWRLHVNQCREQNVINDKFAHWKIEPDKCGSQRHWFVFGCICFFWHYLSGMPMCFCSVTLINVQVPWLKLPVPVAIDERVLVFSVWRSFNLRFARYEMLFFFHFPL